MPPYNTINLHPDSHHPSSLPTDTFDVIYIGSGWSTHVSATRLTKAGMTSVIIEAELFGGECPFWACVPSKALLRPGEAFDEVQGVGGAKERVDSAKGLDVDAVMQRRDTWTSNWDEEKMMVPYIASSGAHLVRGYGKLIGVKKVKVTTSTGESFILTAGQAVVVCTGSEPLIPKIPGLTEAKPWTPREAVSTSDVPKHLLVLGAGVVGCEMVSAFASFGAKVTLVSSTAEILPRVDPEAGAIIRKRFEKQGVNVHLSTTVTRVQREEDGSLIAELAGKPEVKVSEILVAAGRKSRTNGIGLEQFGLAIDGSPINVDDSLCVPSDSSSWLYAVGDVNGRSPTTHGAKYHGRILAKVLLARKNGANFEPKEADGTAAAADRYAIPQVIFTHPNVASVGLTRQKAAAAGRKVKEITALAKTEGAELRMDGYEDGWAQWIVDAESGKLVGATFVGDNVAELLHASTVAVVGGMTLEQLAHAIPSFPTMSEVYLNLLEAAGF
ncbi:dihydrolipoamide dehydrogenase LpdB [Aulographum hederae CBS 113979]|uniref:Dihydrolipoamide dehydrogenase LpdB n=1 Tax=Aulographum hederae CBS 113979 TaxID=1176131 RepID=A0A6G1GKS1_9PEZI|nr:dihydrolipoamide dehydrogenase LpdB [Aulographum hederae CBS 113979]